MVYQWKEGSRITKVDAETVGTVCDKLSKTHDGLTPKSLVEYSKPVDSETHILFDWDDEVAAEKWREEQARYVIRSIVAVEEKQEKSAPVRAFFSIRNDDKPMYQSVNVIMQDHGMRNQLLKTALKELKAFKQKYAQLLQLGNVFKEIDAAVESYDNKGA